MSSRVLCNEQIILRAPEPEDLEVMYLMENLPELWLVSDVTVPYSRYVLRNYLENCRNDIYADRELRLMIQLADTGEVAGTIDLIDFSPLHGRAEVGIAILEKYRRKGYAKEALELLCTYAFRQLHLHQVYAYVSADNTISLSLFTACGFSEKARLRQWLRKENGYSDVFLMQKITSFF